MTARQRIFEAISKYVEHGGEFLILQADEERNYYIQFLALDGPVPQLWAEAVSDGYLTPPYNLSPDALIKLAQLGWDAPRTQAHNWNRTVDVDGPRKIRELVDLVITTFEVVYGINDLSNLSVIEG